MPAWQVLQHRQSWLLDLPGFASAAAICHSNGPLVCAQYAGVPIYARCCSVHSNSARSNDMLVHNKPKHGCGQHGLQVASLLQCLLVAAASLVL
jgi:hypothetical protein